MDRQRVRHRLRRRHHHSRRPGRPLRAPPGLLQRPGAVHARLGGVRARPQRVRADRRPHGAGTRGSGSAAAQPHDSDDRIPAREAGDDRRRLRGARWPRRRARADRRRRDHRSDRLALDLLDQRPDRARGCGTRSAAPTRELRRAGAARPDRRLARHRRCGRARLGADSRQRRRLGQHPDRRAHSPPARSCSPRFSGGSTMPPSRWCRCGCLPSASSRSATSPRS